MPSARGDGIAKSGPLLAPCAAPGRPGSASTRPLNISRDAITSTSNLPVGAQLRRLLVALLGLRVLLAGRERLGEFGVEDAGLRAERRDLLLDGRDRLRLARQVVDCGEARERRLVPRVDELGREQEPLGR